MIPTWFLSFSAVSSDSQQRIRGGLRLGIGWRISLGFAVFGVAVGSLFLLTRSTLAESEAVGQYIDEVLTPSLEALEDLDRTVSEGRVLIRHWLSVQSGPDDSEKLALKHLVNQVTPAQMAKLDQLAAQWSAEDQLRQDSLARAIDHMFIVYGEIMRLLPDFEAYDDPLVTMDAEYYALDGSSLPKLTSQIRNHLDRLTTAQTESLRASTARMAQLGNRLRLYAGNVALGVLILGILIAYFVTRSITVPVKALKKALLYMGRGVPPEAPVTVRGDEIGEMALAANRLAEGLQATRAFSLEVGRGNFDATYTPLSEEDALGRAILKMRDDLASNEAELEGKVQARTAEVEEQRERIEVLYRDLKDSIEYAERIQQAILPTALERSSVFRHNAVFYRPRDVVSGDFYWFHSVGRLRMFAAVDCTGHGVPGAFMSLIGYQGLERVTKVYTEPNDVLGALNRSAREVLHSEGEINSGDLQLNDGMDCAFVTIDMERMELKFSGANSSLYIVSAAGSIEEIKPDKLAIASFEPATKSYTLHTRPLQSGDVVFATTDGFPDQFGGEQGKKFMRKRLRELFKEVAALPASEQEAKLAATFDAWKGHEQQVDDVLVIAVRV